MTGNVLKTNLEVANSYFSFVHRFSQGSTSKMIELTDPSQANGYKEIFNCEVSKATQNTFHHIKLTLYLIHPS